MQDGSISQVEGQRYSYTSSSGYPLGDLAGVLTFVLQDSWPSQRISEANKYSINKKTCAMEAEWSEECRKTEGVS